MVSPVQWKGLGSLSSLLQKPAWKAAWFLHEEGVHSLSEVMCCREWRRGTFSRTWCGRWLMPRTSRGGKGSPLGLRLCQNLCSAVCVCSSGVRHAIKKHLCTFDIDDRVNDHTHKLLWCTGSDQTKAVDWSDCWSRHYHNVSLWSSCLVLSSTNCVYRFPSLITLRL